MSDLRACAQRASCTGWEPCADEGHRNPPGAKVRRNWKRFMRRARRKNDKAAATAKEW